MIIEAIQSINEFLSSVTKEQWKTVLSCYVDFAAITGITNGISMFYHSSKSNRLSNMVIGAFAATIVAPIAASMILWNLKPMIMNKLFGPQVGGEKFMKDENE